MLTWEITLSFIHKRMLACRPTSFTYKHSQRIVSVLSDVFMLNLVEIRVTKTGRLVVIGQSCRIQLVLSGRQGGNMSVLAMDGDLYLPNSSNYCTHPQIPPLYDYPHITPHGAIYHSFHVFCYATNVVDV